MSKVLLFCITLVFTGCVSVPIPPIGDRVGELGNLKLSVKVSYEPKSSPERPPSDSMQFAWEQFGLTQPKLLKDK
jgi:hypothetical protein